MKISEPGIFKGLSFADYQAIDAINQSALKQIARSPMHFYASVLDPNREIAEPTEAMTVGRGLHTYILEHELFDENFCVIPEDAPRRPTSVQLNAKKPSDETLATIEWWRDFDTKNAGKEQLKSSQFQTINEIAHSFWNSRTQAALFSEGSREETIVWEDPLEQVMCKGRVDFVNEFALIDVKSTQDASQKEFSRSAFAYGYHMQAAFYIDGYKALTGKEYSFIFAVFEKTAPYACRFYVASEKLVEYGRKAYRKLLADYAKAKKTGIWEGYPDELTTLELPPWAEKQIAESPQDF